MSNRDICLCGQMFSAHNKNFCITNVNGNEDKMSTFKNIEKLGLKVETCRNAFGDKDFVITAISLESLLQSAQVVYGLKEVTSNAWCWFDKASQTGLDTHTAILLAITPIKKQTKAEAALDFVESLAKDTTKFWNVATLEEAKRILEMKDEV